MVEVMMDFVGRVEDSSNSLVRLYEYSSNTIGVF